MLSSKRVPGKNRTSSNVHSSEAALPTIPSDTTVENKLAEDNRVSPTGSKPGGLLNTTSRVDKQPSVDISKDKGSWFVAFKNILPVYASIHLAFFAISCLSVLFRLPDFSWQALPIPQLWESWNHWDTAQYTGIAMYGYNVEWRTAFFPLYPLLIKGLMLLKFNPLPAGLFIANLAELGMFGVLYHLVEEDFDAESAFRAVLYLSVFLTAFFLTAAYTESLFLFLTILSFYYIRHGRWQLAGIFGCLASLTHSGGYILIIPFFYEYLRQRQFNLKAFRLNMLSGLAIPAGLAAFATYCYFQFHDLLAFEHAQTRRTVQFPWAGIVRSIVSISQSRGFLSFQALRNLLDLGPDLFVLTLIILIFVGPWRFPRRLWSYGFYAAILYLFIQFFPHEGTQLFPLEADSRYMLELFPAFIIMANISKPTGVISRTFHLSYLMVSGALLFFMLTQFLTGHWVL